MTQKIPQTNNNTCILPPYECIQPKDLVYPYLIPMNAVLNTKLPPNTITFNLTDKEVAKITPDGILHFTVDPTEHDVEKLLQTFETCFSRRITGVEINKPRAMYLYVWETDIGVSNDPPLRDDIVAIQGGYLQVVQIVDGKAFYYSESQETPVETAIDYGDYHSVETPF